MATIFNNYTLLSIGYACGGKKYIETVTKQPTHFFDRLGTPMWAICEMLENNFDGFLDQNKWHNIKPITIFNEEMPTHDKYYIRAKHDFFKNNIRVHFKRFNETYFRRIERFIEILAPSNKIVFIRIEEEYINVRNLTPEQQEKYSVDEYQYVLNFCNIMKTKFGLTDFFVLYISTTKQNNFEHNIITLHSVNLYSWFTVEKDMKKLIEDNTEFITKCINKNVAL
jgi:hypothetical protein